MLNLEKIGKKISTRRKELNMKQSELAESLFVTHQAVSKWENGKALPTIDLLYELTNILSINIDYLLDDSEIDEHDFETKLRQLPRKSVIKEFLENDPNKYIENFFYLLTNLERKQMIDLVINQKTSIKIENLWHLLSKNERGYLLSIILSCKYDFDLSEIYHQLTRGEQLIALKSFNEGLYPYKLPTN